MREMGGLVAEAGVRTVPVVVVQPVAEGIGPLPGVVVGAGIGPLAQAGLHQAFGLAVGARGIGARAQVAQTEATGQTPEAARPVTGAVVGQHPLESHAQTAVVAERADQSLAGAGSALVRLDGGEGHPRVIVDGQVDVLPADAPVPMRAVAGHTVARGTDPPQFLDVQVQQLAGLGVLVAVLRQRRLQFGQAMQPGTAQQPGDGAGRHGQPLGDLAIGPARATLLQHLRHDGLRRGMGAGLRSGASVNQARRAFLPVPLEPLVGRAYAHAGRMGGLLDAQALHEDAVHKQGSTARAQTGMFMQVHPGSWGLVWCRNPHLPAMPRMNNLLRDHT